MLDHHESASPDNRNVPYNRTPENRDGREKEGTDEH
jgi:hypothetical protein